MFSVLKQHARFYSSRKEKLFDELIKPKVEFLQRSIGLGVQEFRYILREYNQLYKLSLKDDMEPVVVLFTRSDADEVIVPELTRKEICSIIQSYPAVLNRSVELEIKPILRFWKRDLKLTENQIKKLITNFPRLMSYEVDPVKSRMIFLHNRSATTHQLVNVFSSFREIMEISIKDLFKLYDYCRSQKLRDKDFVEMTSKYPQMLGLHTENTVKPILEYLVFVLRDQRAVHILVNRPELFGVSLESISRRMESLLDSGFKRPNLLVLLRDYPRLIDMEETEFEKNRLKIEYLINRLSNRRL